MKKTLFFLSIFLLLFVFSCKKMTNSNEPITETSLHKRTCGAQQVLEAQMAANPNLRKRMQDIEKQTRIFISHSKGNRLVNGVIEIPVVVHVLYNTTDQNISDKQVQSQITVLNSDYNNTNLEVAPDEFQAVRGKVGIRFVIDSPASQIIHKYTSTTSFSPDDAVKFSSKGGDDPIDPLHQLNLWVCNLGNDLLGYAQFPGGDPGTDGIVLNYRATGTKALYPSGTYWSNYDLGRTATHEVGHWLNLIHIWGDAACGDDFVDDTPVAEDANYFCTPYPKISICGDPHNEMTMNYMDYSDDGCMYMFTAGQAVRANAVFAAGGPRETFNK